MKEPVKEFGFNVLRLPFESTDWVDADYRMFHACFEILGQFVNDELGVADPKQIDDENEDTYRGYKIWSVGHDEQAAIDLWIWYRDELPVIKQAHSDELAMIYNPDQYLENHPEVDRKDLPTTCKFGPDYLDDLCDQKFNDLMAIRRSLWI